ncbi:ABC transporter ATP-binding protein [Alkalihalobacterium alkalinitrilicum]|uniref:ABC transporter ATP-binding protein n=1 Tax=Alkalihalobacterium alkalinitrilicum TaxID=427920 RepID=UPI00099571D4|nr:ABC transporter ATP-binding protein [Alkalihalobacterium alkalinitrilicum]
MEELLDVKGLTVTFPQQQKINRVVDDISFSIRRNEVIGLVGESGSGKTVTATAVLSLTRQPAKIETGQIIFQEEDLLAKKETELQKIRGSQISMIFQNPRTSLNPLMKVGEQIARAYKIHSKYNNAEAKAESLKMLKLVGIPDPNARYDAYPHELSGGMCQRIMIAMALACNPDLLIADEPTTGLDVTIEAQIFDLIKELQKKLGMSVLLITHDLGIVAETCDRVAVMYGGNIVEMADVQTIFKEQKHPYSQHLIGSLLRLDQNSSAEIEIEDITPGIDYNTQGCRYANRCPVATEVCFSTKPVVTNVGDGHTVMCHLYGEEN